MLKEAANLGALLEQAKENEEKQRQEVRFQRKDTNTMIPPSSSTSAASC
jgi:hypothetical protein